LQVEQRRRVLGVAEDVGRGLVDRHRTGAGRGVRLLAAMQADRVELQKLGFHRRLLLRAWGANLQASYTRPRPPAKRPFAAGRACRKVAETLGGSGNNHGENRPYRHLRARPPAAARRAALLRPESDTGDRRLSGADELRRGTSRQAGGEIWRPPGLSLRQRGLDL